MYFYYNPNPARRIELYIESGNFAYSKELEEKWRNVAKDKPIYELYFNGDYIDNDLDKILDITRKLLQDTAFTEK